MSPTTIPWQKPWKPRPELSVTSRNVHAAQVLVESVASCFARAERKKSAGSEVEVEQAIAVGVEKGDPGPVGRGHVLVWGHARDVDKSDAGLSGDLFEAEWTGLFLT